MYVHFEFYDCLYLIIYTGFFTGMGPMPWTINSEIYPLWARSFSNSVATFTNWSFNLLISMTFLSLSDAITRHGQWCCHYTNIYTTCHKVLHSKLKGAINLANTSDFNEIYYVINIMKAVLQSSRSAEWVFRISYGYLGTGSALRI